MPVELFPELAALHIPLDGFDPWLEENMGAPGDMYRVQTLTRYGNDDTLTRAYHRGEPAPYDEWAAWGKELVGYLLANQTYRNLHVIDGPLSPDMACQFGWAYPFNAHHGMDIRVLDVAEQPAAREFLAQGDYWVIDHHHVVLCDYDADGIPNGYTRVEPAGRPGTGPPPPWRGRWARTSPRGGLPTRSTTSPPAGRRDPALRDG